MWVGVGGSSQNYYDATDCYSGAALVIQTPNTLSVGDVIEYDVSTGYPYKCAEITGVSSCTTASCATASQATSNVYTSCCDANEANNCRGLSGFSTPTNGSSSAYNSSGYLQTVEFNVIPSPGYPGGYVINEYTKVSVEAKLGGRAATTVVASDFGTSTSTYLWSGVNVQHNYDGSGCFNAATETLEWRLKVECGSWSGSAYVNCSTAYGAWQSATLDHAGASQQCSTGGGGGGGSNFVVTDCTSGSTAIIDDSGSIGASVGDFVDWYDNNSNGPFCGELTASSSGTATGSIYSNYYMDCSDCNSSNGLGGSGSGSGGGSGSGSGGGGSYIEATDCNSGATHIMDDPNGYAPSVGDVVSYYDKATYSTVYCGTVTSTSSSGTPAYEVSYSYYDCDECNDYEGL